MTTHILEVAERMADRIGVIAGGRLIAEGTLDELRRQAGKGGTSLEDTFLTLVGQDSRRPRDRRRGTLAWFARHECRLAWRDWLCDDDRPGSRSRARDVAIWPSSSSRCSCMPSPGHGRRLRAAGPITGPAGAARWSSRLRCCSRASLMLSQAMELVTRAFYARADLDLILSSPVSARRLFAVRIGAMALSIACDGAAAGGALHQRAGLARRPATGSAPMASSWRWRMAAAALAVALTVALFRVIGPKRTRLVAQIVAAVVGAAFVIGVQVAAILSTGTLSRLDVPAVGGAGRRCAPAAGQPRSGGRRAAILGDRCALLAVVIAGALHARRGDRGFRAALRRACDGGRAASRRWRRDADRPRRRVPQRLADAGAAAQGMDAAAPRSLARSRRR